MTKRTQNRPSNMGPNMTKPSKVTAPASAGTVLRPSYFSMQTVGPGIVRMRGHELLGLVVNEPSRGRIMGIFDLNPACWANSRLSRIAGTYEKYRYDRIHIKYHPACPTSTTGAVGSYLELEVDEVVTPTFQSVLNHQYSSVSPAWAPHEFVYVRPQQDPTTYILTDRKVGNRSEMSQGKVAVIADTTAAGPSGYVTIDYDVVFMYPELDPGYPGVQYEYSFSDMATASANGNITTTSTDWNSGNQKVVELVLTSPLTNVIDTANNALSYAVGSILYYAWSGTTWLLYNTIEGALSGSNPLRTSVNITAPWQLRYWVRRLTQL